MTEVIIYSTVTCPYCKMLKDYLSDRGIGFVEKYVDQDEEAQKEMVQASGGFMGVPFTVIKTSEHVDTVIGFDKNRIDTLLQIDSGSPTVK